MFSKDIYSIISVYYIFLQCLKKIVFYIRFIFETECCETTTLDTVETWALSSNFKAIFPHVEICYKVCLFLDLQQCFPTIF